MPELSTVWVDFNEQLCRPFEVVANPIKHNLRVRSGFVRVVLSRETTTTGISTADSQWLLPNESRDLQENGKRIIMHSDSSILIRLLGDMIAMKNLLFSFVDRALVSVAQES